MRKPRAYHPPLFALHPLLALYAANVALIPWRDALLPAAASASGALVLWALLALLLKDAGRAAASISVGVWLTFTYDAWIGLLTRGSPQGVSSTQMGLWALVTLGAMVLAGWKHRGTAVVTTFLNVVGTAMCALALLAAVAAQIAIGREMARVERASPKSSAVSMKGRPPDIFHIVLDGYGRTDVFERGYGFSDRGFVDALRQRGFFVAEDARTNYVQTELSIASMLNMQPLQALVRPLGKVDEERAVLDAMIDRSEVSKTLRARGYRYIALTTGFPALEFRSADVVLGSDEGRSLFFGALMAKTPFRTGSWAAESQFASRRKVVLGAFENLKRLAAPGSSPRFVIAHVLAPHPPFVFGPNGEAVRPRGLYALTDGSHFLQSGKTRAEYVEGYRGQARTIARLTLEAVDVLLKQPGPAPIIVIHGDHGPKAHLDQDSLRGTDVNESFPILEAVLAPPAVQTRLGDRTTLVNVYRAILSGVFGDALPPLADRSYYSAWMSPLEFEEVTDKITLRHTSQSATIGSR